MLFKDLALKKLNCLSIQQTIAIHIFPNNYGIMVAIPVEKTENETGYGVQIIRKITEISYTEDSFNPLYDKILNRNFMSETEINSLLEDLENLPEVPLRGLPKYKVGDKVVFKVKGKNDSKKLTGIIKIVDAQGTFYNPFEVSYDILGKDGLFYKHISEKFIHN